MIAIKGSDDMGNYVNKALEWFSTRDNVTYAIAIAAFVMSVYNFVVNIIQHRQHIEVELSGIFRPTNVKGASDVVNLKILNCSYSPVIISRITISSSLGNGDYGSYRRELLQIDLNAKGSSVSCEQWFSDRLPVRIDGKSFADILIVPSDSTIRIPTGEKLTVKLYSSKKLITKKITVTSISAYKLLSRCRAPEN